MIPAASAIAVRHARKSYRARRALEGVSFELASGEFLALLGPNGAGKTTLIRALCGRVRLDGGEIELLGRRLLGGTPPAELGFVPQEIALYGDLTLHENLSVFGRLHGVDRRKLRSRIAEVLEWTGLTDRKGEFARNCSGGMQRRLNVGCAVLHRPQILLLDEPTVGVDPQSQEKIFEMLNELRCSGASILLTTHQLESVETRCDRIVIIDHGRVIAQGTLGELIAATVGSGTQARARLAHPIHPLPGGFVTSSDGLTISGSLVDTARDVPRVIEGIVSAGGQIEEFSLVRPSLQSVFLHLTGRELRD